VPTKPKEKTAAELMEEKKKALEQEQLKKDRIRMKAKGF
jgi:hypothetical protein